MWAGPNWLALSAISKGVHEFVLKHPDATFHSDGEDALYSTFVPNLRNATPFYLRWPGLPLGQAYEEKRKEFISSNRPLILIDETHFPGLDRETVARFHYTVLRSKSSRYLLLLPE